MIIKIEMTIMSEEGATEVVEEVARLEREKFSPEELGLNLGEAKAILSGLQRRMVEQQAAEIDFIHFDWRDCPYFVLRLWITLRYRYYF